MDLEAEYDKIREKLSEAAKLVREAGKIAEKHNIALGSSYNDYEYRDHTLPDDGVDESLLSDEELDARNEQLDKLQAERETTEVSLGNELESAMDEAGWRTSSWGC